MKMKTPVTNSKKIPAWIFFTAGFFLVGVVIAQPTPPPTPQVQTRNIIMTTDGPGSSDGSGSSQNVIKIESIEPDQAKEPAREVTWLGVSTEEASEALASQLALKPGEGLVVMFVAPDSPAAKAGIQKYDVIEQLGDQMLVDAAQLRKLVQMQKDGDTIKLALYRGGKKQTVSATLAKRTEDFGTFSSEPSIELSEMAPSSSKSGDWPLKNLKTTTMLEDINKQLIDKQTVNAEVQRNMEEVRRALKEAMRQSAQASRPMWPAAPMVPVAPQLPALPEMVDVGNGATLTVTKDGASVKSIVRSDDTGVFVIVASPKKHLTAHDPDGKLLFDGEIETPEQQQKVPVDLWQKVKPLLQQIKPAEDMEPQPHAQSEGQPKI
jgi:hypothetical protein